MSHPTQAEAMAILTAWAKQYEQIKAAYEPFAAALGLNCENKIFNALYDLFDVYTAAASRLLGDDYCMMSWYCFDNDMGKGGMKANYKKGAPTRKIDTLEKLEQLIRGWRNA